MFHRLKSTTGRSVWAVRMKSTRASAIVGGFFLSAVLKCIQRYLCFSFKYCENMDMARLAAGHTLTSCSYHARTRTQLAALILATCARDCAHNDLKRTTIYSIRENRVPCGRLARSLRFWRIILCGLYMTTLGLSPAWVKRDELCVCLFKYLSI